MRISRLRNSTIGFGVPVFGVFADDNKPRFRDGGDWPDKILEGDGRGQEAGYKGGIAIESFTPEIVELAGAVCFWRHMEPSQDGFAEDGLKFLRQLFA